jgi:catechol 2,3-dioxygenase-like lactoylglutathione lyase family enzyme
MGWHVGRLIDHVHLRVANVAVSRLFYEAALGALGLSLTESGDGWFSADELFVSALDVKTAPSRVHLAFQARDADMVRAFHAAGLRAGGRDNGPPGERHYHPGYYAAFVLDPDGNNIEAVYHGANRRSADSIEITRA